MFQVEESSQNLRLMMSPSLENIDEADASCTAWLSSRQFAVNAFAIRILLREALLNAVTHGCGEDPDGIVRLEIVPDDRGLCMTVEDSGPGFIWQSRGIEFDVMGDGGRGLPLMQIYASEMSFSEQGNRVTLRRDYEAAAVACHGGVDGSQS
jgi:serine/threonine-protein kinase RsbW